MEGAPLCGRQRIAASRSDRLCRRNFHREDSDLAARNAKVTSFDISFVDPRHDPSTVRVIDLFPRQTTHTIKTGGMNRADELCFDPRDELVLVATDAESRSHSFPLTAAHDDLEARNEHHR
jgi:hypothetical protein